MSEVWLGFLLSLSCRRFVVSMQFLGCQRKWWKRDRFAKCDQSTSYFGVGRSQKLCHYKVDDKGLSKLSSTDGEERGVQSHDVRPVQLRLVLGLRETMDGGLPMESLVRMKRELPVDKVLPRCGKFFHDIEHSLLIFTILNILIDSVPCNVG